MKTNKGFASVGIIIAIIAILMVGGVAYYAGNKSKKTESTPEINAVNQSPQKTSSEVNYEDTSESKVVHENDLVYLTNFETKSDGYLYLTFKYYYDNAKLRIFRAPADLKVVTDCYDYNFNNAINSEDFAVYKSKLILKDGYYWNPANQRIGHYNGYYEMTINNGMVVEIMEVDCSSGGD